ncbi:hypothetical protein CHS0354_038213 [Potamilus streckersoni]|uniref:Uncharacterized protein n=1 Tax=Potamilus streckersoni TaxID=2493646 RepID=A0AAE0W4W8_9BIVA|nr:hypothetical protein CHS0354_038213 [Potamilus streckersoni]
MSLLWPVEATASSANVQTGSSPYLAPRQERKCLVISRIEYLALIAKHVDMNPGLCTAHVGHLLMYTCIHIKKTENSFTQHRMSAIWTFNQTDDISSDVFNNFINYTTTIEVLTNPDFRKKRF